MKQVNLKKSLKLNLRGIKTIQQLEKTTLPVIILNAIIEGGSPFVTLYLSGRIIDELMGRKNIHVLTQYVVIMISINLAASIISSFLNDFRNYKCSQIWGQQNFLLNKKMITMDYEYLENNGVRNKRRDLSDIQNMNGGGIVSLYWNLQSLLLNGMVLIYSIAITVTILTKNVKLSSNIPYLSEIISCGFILLILLSIFTIVKDKWKFQFKLRDYIFKVIPINRISIFYFWEYLIDPKPGKDIRMFNQKPILQEQFYNMGDEFKKVINKITKTSERSDSISGGISAFLGGLVYIYLGLKAVYGMISIGSIVNYAGCITKFIDSCSSFINIFSEINANSQYLEPYFEFLDLPEVKYQGTIPVEKRDDDLYELEFRNVSFKYPGSEEYVLKNFSIKLKIGEKLAVVGRNGSGKTTFIKLVCRLYDPTEGEILLNGINVKKYDYKEYMSIFSVVFQDFQLLSFGLGQNVAADVEYNSDLATLALRKAGFGERLNSLDKGLETCINKDYDKDGVEISGGEAQKVAIARALYHDAPFIILDEPTAALDPLAEYDIYSKFDTLVGTKTAIYISHRLASCRFCNDIAVFKDGNIVERGSHEELVKNTAGLYNEMWNAQAQYYNA